MTQEGGTGSLGGARGTPRVVYKAPTQNGGFVFLTEEAGILSQISVRNSLAAGLITVINGIPPIIADIAIGGVLPVSFTNDVTPQVILPEGDGGGGDGGDGGGDGGTAGVGGSSGAAQSTEETFQPIAPPIMDILADLAARRQATRDAALANFEAVRGAAPQMVNPAARWFPGLGPGGLASIALGQSSGLGTEAAEGLIPSATREFYRVPLPGLGDPQEPTLGSEFGGAMGLAKQILDAIRLFQTGQAQSTQSQSSTGGSGSSSSLEASVIQALIGDTLGPVAPESGF